MTVRILDLATDDFDAVYEVMRLCHEEENPAEPPRTQAEAESFLRHPPSASIREYLVAEEGEAVVGFAQLAADRDSPVARVEVLVHPDARRQGHGTALLENVVEAALRLGVRELIGAHATEAGSAFAARVGAVDRLREVRSLLRLPATGSAAAVDGYELESWVGAAPERLLDSFARAREAINDAPFPSDDEVAVWDGERVRDLEAALARRNRDIRVTVALDGEDEVVAFTELRVSRDVVVANTEDTAVVAKHRNQGLGRWVKLESLQRLHAELPEIELVTTTNAEQNEPMLRLNRSLGFEQACVQTSCVLGLASTR